MYNMKASFLLFSLLTSIGLCSCSSHKEAPLPPQTKQAAPAPKPKPLPVQIGEPVAGVDSFAVQMFSGLAASQESNFAFSPLGVEEVLHLLKQGSRGTTATELNALPLGSVDSGTNSNMTSANSLFIDNGCKLKDGIRRASVVSVPFRDNPQEAAAQINAWVSANTKGFINQVIDTPSTGTRMIAVNALHFKAKWDCFINSSDTDLADFTRADGSKKSVNMMLHTAMHPYAAGDDWQAIAMQYRSEGKDKNTYFIAILPKGDARTFAAKLTPQKYHTIRQALQQAKPRQLEVKLPCFEIFPADFSIKQALAAMGVTSAFSPGKANYTGFTDESIFLEDIIQRCHVYTNEDGTEAAACTHALVWLCIRDEEPDIKKIIFNRPFIWVIGDLTSTAPPYFMGITENPEVISKDKEPYEDIPHPDDF